MHTIEPSIAFKRWLATLRDRRAKRIIVQHIEQIRRLPAGAQIGKSLGGGLLELRIHYGPGYRIYCSVRRNQLVVLLCAGDKSSQRRDIVRARQMLRDWRNEHGNNFHIVGSR